MHRVEPRKVWNYVVLSDFARGTLFGNIVFLSRSLPGELHLTLHILSFALDMHYRTQGPLCSWLGTYAWKAYMGLQDYVPFLEMLQHQLVDSDHSSSTSRALFWKW